MTGQVPDFACVPGSPAAPEHLLSTSALPETCAQLQCPSIGGLLAHTACAV